MDAQSYGLVSDYINGKHLLSAYLVPGAIIRVLHMLTHSMLTTLWGGYYYHPHFLIRELRHRKVRWLGQLVGRRAKIQAQPRESSPRVGALSHFSYNLLHAQCRGITKEAVTLWELGKVPSFLLTSVLTWVAHPAPCLSSLTLLPTTMFIISPQLLSFLSTLHRVITSKFIASEISVSILLPSGFTISFQLIYSRTLIAILETPFNWLHHYFYYQWTHPAIIFLLTLLRFHALLL